MNINNVKVGYLRTNCYILEKDGKVLVIDPAYEYLKIKRLFGVTDLFIFLNSKSASNSVMPEREIAIEKAPSIA